MQGSTVKYWKRNALRRYAPEAWAWEPKVPRREVRSRRRAGVYTRLPFGVRFHA